jgi:carbamoyl-phosphate synthase large subunit
MTVRILFLGASRFVGLLERFHTAAAALGIGLEIFSFEDGNPWHAVGVAGLAKVVAAPRFNAPEFEGFLLRFARESRVDIVIPHLDRATIALARTAPNLRAAGVLPVCSSPEVCEAMADKTRADAVFRSLGLPVPASGGFPLLAKPRFGASSRGIVLLHDQEELDFWRKRNPQEDFMLQALVTGKEYSLDGYVDGRNRLLGMVSRVRVVVEQGEVMVTRTEHNEKALAIAQRLLRWGRWHGPLTVQVICDGQAAYLLECNPRFGSGVGCSIEAGLAAPEWILRERLGLPLPDQPISWRDGLCMSRSRKDHFLWLS